MNNTLSTDIRTAGFELKFVLDTSRADAIIDWARSNMDADPYGSGDAGDEYTVSNLYFDTKAFDTFYRNGSYARAKYRIRRYNKGQHLFLERKLRKSDRVNKRRTSISLEEIEQLNRPDQIVEWPGNWFHRRLRLRKLRPVCQIAYERTARIAKVFDRQVRFTADRDIRVAEACGLAFWEGEMNQNHIDKSKVLIEFKFPSVMPDVFEELVANFMLEPIQVSKYRMGVSKLRRFLDKRGKGQEGSIGGLENG